MRCSSPHSTRRAASLPPPAVRTNQARETAASQRLPLECLGKERLATTAEIESRDGLQAGGEDGGMMVLAIQSDSLYTEKNFLKWKEL